MTETRQLETLASRREPDILTSFHAAARQDVSTPLKASVEAAGRRSVWRAVAEAGASSEFVEACWEGVGGWARSIRLLPDGCADIVWDGNRLLIFAPQSSAVRRVVRERTANFGVRLRCGQAGLLFGAPPSSLGAADTSLRQLWGSLAEAGEARLRRSQSFGERRDILLHLIGERAADVGGCEPPPLEAIEALRSDEVPLAALCGPRDRTGRDSRRAFARHVGLSPKALQRVFRFRRLLATLQDPMPARGGGARIAAEVGYADQAHMIRDCQAICGSTPGQLRQRLQA